jgi:copper chaperone
MLWIPNLNRLSDRDREAENDKPPPPLSSPVMSRTITVEGMSCDHCEQSVEEALEGVDDVESATADRESDSATVEGDADPDALVTAISEAGYDASA